MMTLHSYIAAEAGRKFRYGRHDCVTFAGAWAEHVTGRKIVPPYASKAEGLAVLADRSILEILRDEFAEVPKLRAQRGDIAVFASDSDLPALGLVCGARVAVFTGRQIGYAALSNALHVFRVTA